MICFVKLSIAGLLLVWLSGCATATPPPQGNWRPAQNVAEISERELLVTIPLAEPQRMAELNTALQQTYGIDFLAEWPINTLDIYCFVFRLPEDAGQAPNLTAMIERLRTDARIDSVQPMRVFETLDQGTPYNDTYLDLQHGLETLGVAQAHRWATGKGVKIGVIDTGIDVAHPDLNQNVTMTRNFVGDRDGHIVAETHGTAVAGVIAAQADNRIGIVGIAPDAELIGLRGCWQDPGRGKGYCSSFTLARAINFAIVQQIDVLNLSLQGPNDPLLGRLLRKAIEQGMTVVAAHKPATAPGVQAAFPASLPGVLAVVSTDMDMSDTATFAVASDQASAPAPAALRAPGTDILTTMPDGSYNFISGSSFATAHVSGIVALLKERAPGLSPRQAATLLQTSSRSAATLNTAALGLAVAADSVQVNACAALAAMSALPDSGGC